MASKYTHVIWDWNGTLLDDAEICMKAINTLLERRKLCPIKNIHAYRDIFGFPVIDFYRRAGFDFNKEPFEIPAREYIALYHSDNNLFRLFNSAVEILTAISEMGLRQVILSASELNNLRSQIKLFDIECYFDEILGISDIYAESKVNLGLEYIQRTGIDINKAILIGDTVHDHVVAKAIGIDCVLIAKGHQHKQTLLECGVTVLDDINGVVGAVNDCIIC